VFPRALIFPTLTAACSVKTRPAQYRRAGHWQEWRVTTGPATAAIDGFIQIRNYSKFLPIPAFRASS
jgi:hypothetical protein